MPCRVPRYNSACRNIFSHYTPRANHRALSECYPTQDCRIRAYRHAVLYDCRLHRPLVGNGLAVDACSGLPIVRKHDAVPDKHIIADRNAFADEGVGRDLAAYADLRATLDLDECADLAFVPNLAPVEIDKAEVTDVLPELDVDELDCSLLQTDAAHEYPLGSRHCFGTVEVDLAISHRRRAVSSGWCPMAIARGPESSSTTESTAYVMADTAKAASGSAPSRNAR